MYKSKNIKLSIKTTELVTGFELHEKVIVNEVLSARDTVWIATANLKDMHVAMARRYRPILEIFDEMASRGVHFRMIHADMPSKPFRDTLDKCPNLISGGLELQICPRSHWKIVVVDNRFAYAGSANFTGAGLGVKKQARRNLELGFVTVDSDHVKFLAGQFDNFWIGEYCLDCAFIASCPDPIQAT